MENNCLLRAGNYSGITEIHRNFLNKNLVII